MEILTGNRKVSKVLFAATGDIHGGSPLERSHEFGTIEQWGNWFREAKEKGAKALILAGDITHQGIPETARAVAKLATSYFGNAVFAITGNHDELQGKTQKVTLAMEEEGVTILDDKAKVVDIDGARIGLIGLNGSIGINEYNALKEVGAETRRRELHRLTEEKYYKTFDTNIQFLLDEKVDYIVPVIHVPVHPGQYSDTKQHMYTHEMTPKIYERLKKIREHVAIVVGGHVHGENPAYRRNNPLYLTKENIAVANVAGPNAILQDLSPVYTFHVECINLGKKKYTHVRPQERRVHKNLPVRRNVYANAA